MYAICKGKLYFLSKLAIRIQSALLCNVPRQRAFLCLTLVPFLTNLNKFCSLLTTNSILGQVFFEVATKTEKNHYAHWLGISLKVPKSTGGWSGVVALLKYYIRLRGACNNWKYSKVENRNLLGNFSHSDLSRKLFYYVDIWYDSVQ